MPNICFHKAQVSWNDIFLVSSQGIPLTKITFQWPWRTMQFLALAYLNKYCNSYFPVTQITYDCGFPHIKLEAAVPICLLSSCS